MYSLNQVKLIVGIRENNKLSKHSYAESNSLLLLLFPEVLEFNYSILSYT